MSYSYQKNEKGTDLVISGWENGIADSAIIGHQQMINVDIFSIPGIVQTQLKSVLSLSTTGLVKWMRRDPTTGDVYALDDTGKLYKWTYATGVWTTITGSLPANQGNGLGIWKGYVFVATDTKLYCASLPATGASTWSPVLDSATGVDMILENVLADWHPIFTNLNTDHLFFGNKFKLGQIIETAGDTFDPIDIASYTASPNVLDLPSEYTIQTIEGMGNNLYLGTYIGTVGWDQMGAVIYPWDKVSDSYDNPIISSGTGVHLLKTIGSTMYAYIGNRGDISITNGSTTQLLKRFYNIKLSSSIYRVDVNPDAMDALNDQEVLIGIGDRTGSPEPVGIYSLRNGVHVVRNLASTGNDEEVRIGSILALDGQRFMFSWRDQKTSPTSYGIDLVGSGGRYSDYSSTIDTDLIPVATFLYATEFSEIEFKLASVLSTDQGIKIWYRTDLNDTWTEIGEWTYATIGARMSYNAPASIVDAEYLQLRIQLKSKSGNNGSPQLKEVRLR